MAVATPARWGDWLDLRTGSSEAATQAVRRGFWLVALAFVVVQAGGALPIPLYVIWQPRFGFGSGVLTLIFTVYTVGTLLALLLIAPLSDQLGRRPAVGCRNPIALPEQRDLQQDRVIAPHEFSEDSNLVSVPITGERVPARHLPRAFGARSHAESLRWFSEGGWRR